MFDEKKATAAPQRRRGFHEGQHRPCGEHRQRARQHIGRSRELHASIHRERRYRSAWHRRRGSAGWCRETERKPLMTAEITPGKVERPTTPVTDRRPSDPYPTTDDHVTNTE